MSEINKTFFADAEEIRVATGKKIRWIQELAIKDSWVFVTEKTRSRHPKKWFLISALPKDIHDKVVLQRSQAEAAVLYGVQPPVFPAAVQAAVDAVHAAQPEAAAAVYTADWEWFRRRPGSLQAKARAQAAVVRQLKGLIDAQARRQFEAESAGLRAKKTPVHDLMQQVRLANPETCQSWKTLQNWWEGRGPKVGCKHFQPADYPAVLAGCHRGRVALAPVSEAAFGYYAGLYLHRRRPSHQDCYRRLQDKAQAEGWVIAAASTLKRRFEAEYSQALITLMREGEEAFRQLIPFQERDKRVFRAGQAVSGDGLKFDKLWVKFPDGEIINTATAWFWADIYSGSIRAWRLGKTESTDLFRLATYDLTGQFLPSYTQVDNTRVAANKMMTGQAEGRHRFGNQPNDPMGMLVMLDMGVHFTSPDHTVSSPGSKPVERAFGIGGLHDKVATNPRIRDRGYSKATAISSEQLAEAIGYEVMRHNSQERRRSPVCGGVLSFDQAFEQSFKSWAPRKASEAQRRLLMLSIEVSRCDSRNGLVRIKAGRSQFGVNRYWCEALAGHRGQDVAVFFDPDDLTQDVDIYSLDGRFLTTAQHEAQAAFTDKAAGAEYHKRTQRLKKLAKKQAEEVRAIQKLHNGPLPDLAAAPMPASTVVAGLFKQPLAQPGEQAGEVIDAEAAFMNFMKMMGA